MFSEGRCSCYHTQSLCFPTGGGAWNFGFDIVFLWRHMCSISSCIALQSQCNIIATARTTLYHSVSPRLQAMILQLPPWRQDFTWQQWPRKKNHAIAAKIFFEDAHLL